MNAGWHASRWASWSSKSVAGSAKLAAVGSTPMPSRYVASWPIENDAPAAYVRSSLKGCTRNCSVSNPFRIARSADVCAQTGLRCVFRIRRAGSSARHFCGQGSVRDSALRRVRTRAGIRGDARCRLVGSNKYAVTSSLSIRMAPGAETFCVGTLALPRPKDGGCGELLRRTLGLWLLGLLGRRRKRLTPRPWLPERRICGTLGCRLKGAARHFLPLSKPPSFACGRRGKMASG